ncbi:DUF1822 family protein [Phormidium tenue FACHB-886]|nr:DUF1822 family protein [Phormidium tenue FACHB-886]
MADPITSEFLEPLDWESQPSGLISLSSAQIQQAMAWSQPIANLEQQWQTYLNALALLSVEQWLHQRAPELVLTDEQCSIRSPIYASLINAVSNLQVGEFKLCILSIGSLTDSQISVPRAVLDLPEFAAHWYVLVEVLEENEQARVWGCFSHDSITQQSDSLPIEPDWNYTVPLRWFRLEPDGLLLSLRCLDPRAIALPFATPSAPAAETILALKKKITAVLPQLRSQQRTLWQVLTWDEGARLLKSRDLMNWLSSELIVQSAASQAVINAAFWLRDQLDTAAQALSLMLMPNAVSAFRSLRGLEGIRADLAAGGIQIPPEAQGTYQDLQWENLDLRLHTFVWTIPASASDSAAEWVLLIVLGAQPNARPPFGIKLEVRDTAQILVEETLEERSNNSYLYAQVIDQWNEQFQITISLNQAIISSLIYEFNPEPELL